MEVEPPLDLDNVFDLISLLFLPSTDALQNQASVAAARNASPRAQPPPLQLLHLVADVAAPVVVVIRRIGRRRRRLFKFAQAGGSACPCTSRLSMHGVSFRAGARGGGGGGGGGTGASDCDAFAACARLEL